MVQWDCVKWYILGLLLKKGREEKEGDGKGKGSRVPPATCLTLL